MTRFDSTSTNANDAVYYRFEVDGTQDPPNPSRWDSLKIAFVLLVRRAKRAVRRWFR